MFLKHVLYVYIQKWITTSTQLITVTSSEEEEGEQIGNWSPKGIFHLKDSSFFFKKKRIFIHLKNIYVHGKTGENVLKHD